MNTNKREREREERGTPPPHTPLKEESRARERLLPLPLQRARTRVRNSRRPTLAAVLEYAERNGIDRSFAERWYDKIANAYEWKHPKTGRPIAHWQSYLEI